MAQFKALSPTVMVNGETVLSVVDGMGAFQSKAYQILEKNGIKDPQPGEWYSQQAWLDAFKDITEQVGEQTLYNIGLKIPENAQFPPDIDSLGKALGMIDIAYHLNHKSGKIGNYNLGKLEGRSIKMVCNNPYPCDFDKGIITCFTRKFKPLGAASFAKVSHDDSAPCRKKGGESCTYIISW